ncbi:MAG: leucine-rich repeat protein [Bacillota bacterium]|nr:leucine-rich repeat protein [Bacillota bacterium]
MRRSKTIAWILSMVMAFTVFGTSGTAVFADETQGTEDAPYPIGSAEAFAKMYAGEGNYYQLTQDITVTTPYASNFAASFDGDGHTVTLNIESAEANTGLFKSLTGGAVVENVNTDGSVVSSNNYVGGIAGEISGDSFIDNCHNSAAVTGAKGNVGGIVGRAYNGVDITDSSNSGEINGSANRVGGIVGYSSGGIVDIDACMNKGAVTGTNNQTGGIVGNVSNGTTTITDCYNVGAITETGQYSNMLGGIIGQVTKSGPTDTLINCYNAGLCSFSQSTNTNIGALVGNKSNNGSTTNCYYLDTSASVAVGGVTAVGAYAKTANEMKSADFVDELNGEEGDSFVAAASNINNGFPILAWQEGGDAPIVEPDPEDQAMVDAIVAKFDGSFGALRPASGTDTNINDFVKGVISGYDIEGLDPDEVSVTLKSSDEPNIAADGTIAYVTRDELNAYSYVLNVGCEFTVTYGTASADTASRTVTLGWDREAFYNKMQDESEFLTEDVIKGENESLTSVEKQLSMPQIKGSDARKSWSVIEWSSSNEDVIHFEEEQYAGVTKPLKGIVTPAEEDATVILTAIFKANETLLNSNVEKQSDFETIKKTFTVTVPGTGPLGPTEEEMQEMLDTYYTADLLKNFDDQSQLDPENVTGDIQLPIYTRIKDENNELVFNNKEITVTSSDESVITINGYRAVVDRLQNEDKTVDLTVTFTRNGISVQKVITVKVNAVTEEELDKEIANLAVVKEHYFDGINDGLYASPEAVTGNLHPFQEANVGPDGTITWAYNVADMTGSGIIPDGYFEDSQEMESAGYNRFKSSDKSIIAHENLVVTVPETPTEVTITSWLSSAKYRDMAKSHPDNEKLQKLYKQEVSVTVTVKQPVSPAAVGTQFKQPNGTYEVTSADPAKPEVSYAKAASKATVAIPASITVDDVEYAVTAIAPKAFFKNKKIKKVTVGDNIKTIGASAFARCKKLKTFTLGAGVEKIDAYCFSKSKKLKTITVKSKNLTAEGVAKSLKGSRVKTVKVRVGTKAENKEYIKAYKKIFTKKICGKKVKVK